MIHVILRDGVVSDVSTDDPGGRYHPAVAALFEPAPPQVAVGWRRDGDDWSPPEPEPEVHEPQPPIQLALIDFLRLFTTAELAGFNGLRKVVAALGPADYQAAAGGDQAAAALVGFEVGLTHYDALRAGLIELDHPQTIQWLGLLVPLGVLTAPRLAQVLAGERPEAT